MADNVEWFGDTWLDKFAAEQAKNLERAAYYLENEIKKELGVSVDRKDGQVVTRSDPEEYPRLEEGELRRSITHVIDKDKLVAKVGTNKIYGKYLELGTSQMMKRPFLRVTMMRKINTLKKIMAGNKIKRGE